MADETFASELRARGLELIRMGQEMVQHAASADRETASRLDALGNDCEILVLAKAAHDDRRSRTALFRSDLFGEPGWDILLDLFIQERVGRRISVTGACLGTGAATTTALRYLYLLIDDGLVQREGDPADSRRSWVKLTPHAAEMMTEYLKERTFLGRSRMAVGRDTLQELT
jgi:hypothetical protein